MSLSKKNKIIALIFGLIILGGYSAYKYTYKPHKTIDELDANTWQDVVVELTGTITAIDEKGITLNTTIYCQLEKDISISTLQEKQNVTIKGRMMGYDDLLEEIKLDQTIIK